MNIFILDRSAGKCAEYYCNEDLFKGIRDISSVLSTCHHITDGSSPSDCKKVDNEWVQWIIQSHTNYAWTWQLLFNLCHVHKNRYGKLHTDLDDQMRLLGVLPKNIPEGPMTDRPVPKGYEQDNIFLAYREYYKTRKIGTYPDDKYPDFMVDSHHE